MKKIKMIVLAFLMLGAFIYQGESFKDYMFYLPNNYISFTLSESSVSNTEKTTETIKQIAEIIMLSFLLSEMLKSNTTFDIAFLDIEMKEIDGLKLGEHEDN